MKKTITYAALVAIGTIGSASAALTAGDSIGLDFGASGTAPTNNFNAVGVAGLVNTVLLSDGVTSTGVGVTVIIPGNPNQFDNVDPSAGATITAPYEADTFDDWLGGWGNNVGEDWNFTFTGLDDSLTYDFTAAVGAWTGNNVIDGMTVEAGGTTVTWANLDADNLYATISGISSVGGNLTVSMDNPTSQTVSALSGATLTAIPEPSSAALLGLGGLALILRRRK